MELVTVQFIKPFPPILITVNDNEMILGPFKPGDIVTLPRDLAEKLSSKGIICVLNL